MQVFRNTVREILRVAKSNGVSSIAIPSLGVANLSYPGSVSAKILFQEVITFHSLNPKSILKFTFVIFDKKVFQAFSQEFDQQKIGQESLPQVLIIIVIYLYSGCLDDYQACSNCLEGMECNINILQSIQFTVCTVSCNISREVSCQLLKLEQDYNHFLG